VGCDDDRRRRGLGRRRDRAGLHVCAAGLRPGCRGHAGGGRHGARRVRDRRGLGGDGCCASQCGPAGDRRGSRRSYVGRSCSTDTATTRRPAAPSPRRSCSRSCRRFARRRPTRSSLPTASPAAARSNRQQPVGARSTSAGAGDGEALRRGRAAGAVSRAGSRGAAAVRRRTVRAAASIAVAVAAGAGFAYSRSR
jgi:hypothetical protein